MPRCWRNAAPAGDVDGDGFDDFVFVACDFGAPGADSAGRAKVIFGQPVFPPEADLADLGAAGIRSLDIISREEGRGLGLHARAADLDADGRSDLVISALFEDHAQAHIVFGRESWPAAIDEADVTIRDEPAVVGFAFHTDAGADVDGDGFGDLVMGGMDRDAVWWKAPGRTYLLRGYGASWPRDIAILDAMGDGRAVLFSSRPCAGSKPAFVQLPDGGTRIAVAHALCAGHDTIVDLFRPRGFEAPPERIASIHGDPDTIGVFGTSLAAVGDMDGDGWPELLVGEVAGYSAAYLIPGDAALFGIGETVDVLDLVASGRAVRYTDGGAHISEFGRRSEPAGDFNGDGYPDAIISAEFGGFQLQGRSYVVFGAPELGATPTLDLSADGPTHLKITGERSGDTAGYGQGIGDINGDGYSDLAILGSYQESGRHKAHIVLGERHPPASIDLITLRERGFEIAAPEGVEFRGKGAPPLSSISVVGADFDGDGNQDLAIPYGSGLGEGIFVIFGPILRSGFLRGDANDDGKVDLSDAVAILGYLFLGDEAPRCLDAADANDSGIVEISDAVRLLNHLFLGAPPPPPPYPESGADATPDALSCF